MRTSPGCLRRRRREEHEVSGGFRSLDAHGVQGPDPRAIPADWVLWAWVAIVSWHETQHELAAGHEVATDSQETAAQAPMQDERCYLGVNLAPGEPSLAVAGRAR